MDIFLSIVAKVAEYAVEPAIRQVDYIINCKSKLQDLQTAVDKLIAVKEGVGHNITEAVNKGDQQTETVVTNWLEQVTKITGAAYELEKDDIRGFCPNVKLRYKLGRSSTKLKQAVDDLLKEKEFSKVSHSVRLQEPLSNTYQAFDSRESTIKEIMKELRAPSTNFILVYGLGGVGKTTLVKEVLRQAREEKIFVDEIMVKAEEKPDLKKIQKVIAKELGVEVQQDEDMADIARRICNRIKDNRVLVILDNMLEKFDLDSLGIPCLLTCTIVLTSRIRDVLSSEKWFPSKEFRLEVLDGKDSWSLFKMNLFKMKAGDHILKERAIKIVAREVVKKCGGLPVLVVAVALSLRKRAILAAWNDTLRNLQHFGNNVQGSIEEKAYSGLEWSYNQLHEEKNLKPLFLLSGILQYTEGKIVLSHLLKYAMGLSLLKNVSTVEEANNALYTRIEELKDACLLLDTEDQSSVRMHDLICDVAVSIASKNQQALLSARGVLLKEWPSNKEFLDNCTKISLSCSKVKVPNLPEVLECQELQLFQCLGSETYNFLIIPDMFFKKMTKLMVLNLTNMNLYQLPTSFELLGNLQTLCLHHCLLLDIALVGQLTKLEVLSFVASAFVELPKEIGKLTSLRTLDLTHCRSLRVIAPGVISGLEHLEDLRMRGCDNYKWEVGGLSELNDLSYVTALEIHIADLNVVPTDLFFDNLKRYRLLIGSSGEQNWWDDVDQTLNTIMINLANIRGLETSGIQTLLERSEVVYFEHKEHHPHISQLITYAITRRKVVSTNLIRLTLHNCAGLKALFTYSMATSLVELKYLEVDSCGMMEEIVSTKEHGDENTNGMFPKLRDLVLKELRRLSKFSSRSNILIEFPSLKRLDLNQCCDLVTLILDPKSESTYSLFDNKVAFPMLEKIDIRGSGRLNSIWPHNQPAPGGSFCKLQEVSVLKCPALINIFAPSILARLGALQDLTIYECDSLEVVFEMHGTPASLLKTFDCQNLKCVEIMSCQSLRHVFPCSVATSLQRLQSLKVGYCGKMEEIVAKEEGPETTTPTFVIDVDKVAFPRLQKIDIRHSEKLKTIWPHNQLAPGSFCRLQDVMVWDCPMLIKIFAPSNIGKLEALQSLSVHACHSLRHVFPCSVATTSLQRLQSLRVQYCKEMKEIVAKQEGPETTTPTFEFPRLVTLELAKLPRLESFYPGIHASKWPLLKTLVAGCGELKIFAMIIAMGASNCTRIKQSLVLVDKSDGDGDAAFPLLSDLTLFGMPKLTDICKDDSSSGPIPNKLTDICKDDSSSGPIPKLEVPQAVGCVRLKDLGSSTMPFRNLTSLKVYGCDSLTYLTTYTMAKNLMQLRQMTVANCKQMKQIVATSGLDDGQIFFSQLEELIMYDLPSLDDFCSGNCTAKFPSLKTLCIENCKKLKTGPELRGVMMIDKKDYLNRESPSEPFSEHDRAYIYSR